MISDDGTGNGDVEEQAHRSETIVAFEATGAQGQECKRGELRHPFRRLFCRSWIARVSFRSVRGLIVFLPFLKCEYLCAVPYCTLGNEGLTRH